MPLRDHFRPPLDLITSWEGFHGGWPMVIVQQLRKQLPPGYVAEPRVHSGLPLWLSRDLVVPLNLEQSYEQACSDLWIA